MSNSYERYLKTLMYVFLTVCAFVSLYPIFFSVITSIKTPEEYVTNKLGFPAKLTFDNYSYVWKNGNMLKYFLNTLLDIPLGLAFYLFICVSAGFAFGRLRFKGRLTLFLAVLFLMIFPQMLLSMQIFQICRTLKLVNNYFGLILVWVAYFSPFGTYIMTTYYSTVPMSLVESARLDGARLDQMLFRIMVPIAQPMIVVITIIGTQSMWNELPFSMLLLQNADMRTITHSLGMLKGQYGLKDPILMAAILCAASVPILLFLFFQKQITMGSYNGAVKG